MQALYIYRLEPGVYDWQLVLGAGIGDGVIAKASTPEKSIADSLRAAHPFLVEEEPHVQLWYRSVCMGTVRAAMLSHGPDSLADRLVDLYAELF